MKPFWKQLLYLYGHVVPTDLCWREDAPEACGHRASPAAKSVAPMLRWREALRAAWLP